MPRRNRADPVCRHRYQPGAIVDADAEPVEQRLPDGWVADESQRGVDKADAEQSDVSGASVEKRALMTVPSECTWRTPPVMVGHPDVAGAELTKRRPIDVSNAQHVHPPVGHFLTWTDWFVITSSVYRRLISQPACRNCSPGFLTPEIKSEWGVALIQTTAARAIVPVVSHKSLVSTASAVATIFIFPPPVAEWAAASDAVSPRHRMTIATPRHDGKMR